jgi:CheY-like chemotaxis protein
MYMDKSAPRILIADDQPDVREALRLLLKGEGYQTETASSPAGILTAATRLRAKKAWMFFPEFKPWIALFRLS